MIHTWAIKFPQKYFMLLNKTHYGVHGILAKKHKSPGCMWIYLSMKLFILQNNLNSMWRLLDRLWNIQVNSNKWNLVNYAS
jgi:hypothetical protein